MDAKTEARRILDGVTSQGAGGDNFYSKDFRKWCKEKSVARAKSKFEGAFLEQVILEILA